MLPVTTVSGPDWLKNNRQIHTMGNQSLSVIGERVAGPSHPRRVVSIAIIDMRISNMTFQLSDNLVVSSDTGK